MNSLVAFKKSTHSVAFGGLLLCLLAGCSGGGDTAAVTVEGTVKYDGKAVPSGSRVVFEDRKNGVNKLFEIGADGQYTVAESAKLPPGKYAVAVVPPATTNESEDYDKLMGDAGAGKKKGNDEFPVPEKFRQTTTSGKTVEVKAGSQALDIDFGE